MLFKRRCSNKDTIKVKSTKIIFFWKLVLFRLEDTARYVAFLLAPVEGFGHKRSLLVSCSVSVVVIQ